MRDTPNDNSQFIAQAQSVHYWLMVISVAFILLSTTEQSGTLARAEADVDAVIALVSAYNNYEWRRARLDQLVKETRGAEDLNDNLELEIDIGDRRIIPLPVRDLWYLTPFSDRPENLEAVEPLLHPQEITQTGGSLSNVETVGDFARMWNVFDKFRNVVMFENTAGEAAIIASTSDGSSSIQPVNVGYFGKPSAPISSEWIPDYVVHPPQLWEIGYLREQLRMQLSGQRIYVDRMSLVPEVSSRLLGFLKDKHGCIITAPLGRSMAVTRILVVEADCVASPFPLQSSFLAFVTSAGFPRPPGPFPITFSSLDRVTKNLSALPLADFKYHVAYLAELSKQSLDLFGVKVSAQDIQRWGALLLVGAQIWFLMFFREMARRLSESREMGNASWIALHKSRLSQCIFIMSVTALPLLSLGAIYNSRISGWSLADLSASKDAVMIFAFLASLAIGCASWRSWRHIQSAAQSAAVTDG